jgi:AraC family transcriptional regulator, positive regulator of tynA and feaB
MFSWSTDSIRERERFSFWHEMVCKSVLNVSADSVPERFSARITGRSFDKLRFAVFDCTGHELVRSRQQVARAPEDYYVITLHLRSRSRFSQGDETIALEPNEIAIVDGQRPFRIAFMESVKRASAVIPHAMIDQRAPWLRSGPRRKIAANSLYADLVRRHLLQLTGGGPGMSETEAMLLTDNLCNLLALATACEIAPNRMQPELMLEALLAYCRQELHNPLLSPSRVAGHFGISVRTLHLRFQQLGKSFGRWLLENRLDACGKALRDLHRRSDSISEIAYRCGFNDLSHFNKAFRARFGMPPRQWRSWSKQS